MRHLYWSCQQEKANGLLDYVRQFEPQAEVAGMANGLHIIQVPNPNHSALEATVTLISKGRLKSAALVAGVLSSEKFFFASEWWNKFVCEKSELAALKPLGDRLQSSGESKAHDLIVFDVHSEGEQIEANLRPVPADIVLANRENYYEGFTTEELGGANALFAAGQEAAAERGLAPDMVLVGLPGAFGFKVDESESSVVYWQQKKIIEVRALGFALSNWRMAIGGWEASTKAAFDESRIADEVDKWMAEDIRFGLAVILKGLDDPPVVIPMGSIYQQPTMGSHNQNLAVAKAGTYNVGAGATVPIVLPAWCLNPTFSSPHGPMTATPLIAAGLSGSQQVVWNQIRNRYRSGQ